MNLTQLLAHQNTDLGQNKEHFTNEKMNKQIKNIYENCFSEYSLWKKPKQHPLESFW